MTTNRKLYARASALPAIAAALALSSTPLFAQEVQPVTAQPPPAATETPPVTDATPAATDTTAAPETTAEPATTEATTPAAKATKTVKRTTRTVATKPATTARTITTRTVATHAAAPMVTPTTPAPAQPATSQSAVTPVVDVNSTPATPPTTAATEGVKQDDTLPIAAGGALALLVLGGGAVALVRRRRAHEEEEWYEDDAVEPAPTEAPVEPEPAIHQEQPAILAPSAFAWRNAPSEPMRASEPMGEQDDRMQGESWIQRAYRGPTPNNPSVSLRARLKRAAFFDKRERDVAAGKAKPVEMDAGLPEAMVEEQERELA